MAAREVPTPPEVTGVSVPTRWDLARVVWWEQRGFAHGVRHGRWGARVLSLTLWVGWWPTSPIRLVAQALLPASPNLRYYMASQRDAVLGIRRTCRGWHVTEHSSSRPGTAQGKALRSLLLPHLVRVADGQQITIHVRAANKKLAARYAAELPGLTDVGHGWPRGRKMERPPASPGSTC